MAIDWEEAEPAQRGLAQRYFEGIAGSGETYKVWYGPAYLNREQPSVMRWIAWGWPEYDSDSLPHFDSYDEAVKLCEEWERIKLEAERQGRAAYKGLRTGEC